MIVKLSELPEVRDLIAHLQAENDRLRRLLRTAQGDLDEAVGLLNGVDIVSLPAAYTATIQRIEDELSMPDEIDARHIGRGSSVGLTEPLPPGWSREQRRA